MIELSSISIEDQKKVKRLIEQMNDCTLQEQSARALKASHASELRKVLACPADDVKLLVKLVNEASDGSAEMERITQVGDLATTLQEVTLGKESQA